MRRDSRKQQEEEEFCELNKRHETTEAKSRTKGGSRLLFDFKEKRDSVRVCRIVTKLIFAVSLPDDYLSYLSVSTLSESRSSTRATLLRGRVGEKRKKRR